MASMCCTHPLDTHCHWFLREGDKQNCDKSENPSPDMQSVKERVNQEHSWSMSTWKQNFWSWQSWVKFHSWKKVSFVYDATSRLLKWDFFCQNLSSLNPSGIFPCNSDQVNFSDQVGNLFFHKGHKYTLEYICSVKQSISRVTFAWITMWSTCLVADLLVGLEAEKSIWV